MKYFDFFGIPPSFFPDSKELRQAYLKQSRNFHPDFHTLDPEKQAESEEKTALCNEAYTALNDFFRTVEYVLREGGYLDQTGGQNMDPEFLMEMMEINEALMELQFDPDPEQRQTLHKQIESLTQDNENELKQLASEWNGSPEHRVILEQIHQSWLRRKYLLRLKESLTNIAAS